jgi:SAM-dependent methyltransferase
MRRAMLGLSRVWSRLREDGVTRTFAWLRYRQQEARWERRFGVSTSSAVGAASLSRDYEEYQPSDYQLIARALDWARPTPDDVLLDYGCGKGRVLFVGAGYPFRRIVGFELCPEMAALGRANVAAAHLPTPRPPIEILESNAAEEAPPDDATVIFLFNPFYGEVLRETLQRVRESWERAPRDIRVIYIQPRAHQNDLDTFGWLRAEGSVDVWPRRDLRIATYRVVASPCERSVRAPEELVHA